MATSPPVGAGVEDADGAMVFTKFMMAMKSFNENLDAVPTALSYPATLRDSLEIFCHGFNLVSAHNLQCRHAEFDFSSSSLGR